MAHTPMAATTAAKDWSEERKTGTPLLFTHTSRSPTFVRRIRLLLFCVTTTKKSDCSLYGPRRTLEGYVLRSWLPLPAMSVYLSREGCLFPYFFPQKKRRREWLAHARVS